MNENLNRNNSYSITPFIQICRKTPSFSYGDIRHVHRIYANPTRSHQTVY